MDINISLDEEAFNALPHSLAKALLDVQTQVEDYQKAEAQVRAKEKEEWIEQGALREYFAELLGDPDIEEVIIDLLPYYCEAVIDSHRYYPDGLQFHRIRTEDFLPLSGVNQLKIPLDLHLYNANKKLRETKALEKWKKDQEYIKRLNMFHDKYYVTPIP